MGIRRERIPLLWSRVWERTLAKGFNFNMGYAKCLCVYRKMKFSGRCVIVYTVRKSER